MKGQEEIFGKHIKEFKLPLNERIAYYRPVLIWVFWLALTAMIVGPTIKSNSENLWYYLGLIPLVFFFIKAIINLIRFIVFASKCKQKINETVENEHHCDNYSGAPGTGKTFTAMFLQHEKAKYNWEELQFEMWLIGKKLRDVDYKPTPDEAEIIEAYKFYTGNEGVPCWSTNIPGYSKFFKRYAYDVGAAYLKQEERAPYRLCSVFDEIGTVVSVELKDGRKSNDCGATDMTDTFKFCRQFNLWSIVGCEQDHNNIYIDERRVASENRVYSGKKWLLKPRLLCWVYNKLKVRFTKKMSLAQSVRWSGVMSKLKNYISKCGFFKFTYKIRYNTETAIGTISLDTNEKEVVYIPRANEIVYRTRAFREGYKAKNKPIKARAYTSLYMDEDRARSMLKSENLVVKDKKSKEEVAKPQKEQNTSREDSAVLLF